MRWLRPAFAIALDGASKPAGYDDGLRGCAERRSLGGRSGPRPRRNLPVCSSPPISTISAAGREPDAPSRANVSAVARLVLPPVPVPIQTFPARRPGISVSFLSRGREILSLSVTDMVGLETSLKFQERAEPHNQA